MKIGFYKETNLAKNPDIWVDAINKYSGHSAELIPFNRNNPSISTKSIEACDFIHWNNKFLKKFKNKPGLIHYHSEPFRVDLDYNGYKVVNCSYQSTLDEYKNCNPVRWFPIDIYSDLYRYSEIDDIIRICYSPSTKMKVGRWYNKGYPETIKILNDILDKYKNNVVINVCFNLPIEEMIDIKRNSNIVIDECVTGLCHMSGFEGLALGKMTICHVDDSVAGDPLRKITGSDEIPFENVKIENLYDYLDMMVSKGNIGKIISKGKKNRKWIEKYWNIHDVVDEMITHYEKSMNLV